MIDKIKTQYEKILDKFTDTVACDCKRTLNKKGKILAVAILLILIVAI